MEMYKTLSDAKNINDIFKSNDGTSIWKKISIWYMKPGVSRDFGMGYKWLAELGLLPTSPTKLSKTHIKLGELNITHINLQKLFTQMQGEKWSPNGEARDLISKLGLRHTSMSVGDIVIMENEMYIVNIFEFKKINPEDNKHPEDVEEYE